MKTISLRIGDVELSNSTTENIDIIWGEICVIINGVAYPDIGWTDAISAILDMWSLEIIEFLSEKKTYCELYFMDGPFVLRLSSDNKSVLLSYREQGVFENTDINIDFTEFVESFVNEANRFIEKSGVHYPTFSTSKTGIKITNAIKNIQRLQKK